MESGLHFARKTYYDRSFHSLAVKILPGEYHATDRDLMISTVLGSCVSVCVWDPASRIGGMNHFMLPGEDKGEKSESARYGVHAMELLLNHVAKLGANTNLLTAKVFGAGKVMDGMSDVGRQNADFALGYLSARRIPVVAVDLGDSCPRRVVFWPSTGRAMVKRIRKQEFERNQIDTRQRGRSW